MSVIKVENLTVSFGGVKAVDNVSMVIEPGEIRGLIGPNGAGKTTLINTISGAINTSSGKVYLENQNITHRPPDAISALGLGRTFQHVELFKSETVFDNIMTGLYRHCDYGFWRACLGLNKAIEREAKQEARALLAQFGLTEFSQAIAGDLPFGIQKRVDLARAMGVRPRLLLLDEPMSGMSASEADAATATVRTLAKERGITVLIVEHNMRVLMKLASKVTVMHRGKIISQGDPEEVQADPLVVDAYLGEEVIDA